MIDNGIPVESSGKPELEDGYIQLAYELDAAMDLADFTLAERIILSCIKPQVYGAKKDKRAFFSIRAIAAELEVDRRWLTIARNTLLKENVIIIDNELGFKINKYYKTWKPKNGKKVRFKMGSLAFIASRVRAGKGLKNGSEGDTDTPGNSDTPGGNDTPGGIAPPPRGVDTPHPGGWIPPSPTIGTGTGDSRRLQKTIDKQNARTLPSDSGEANGHPPVWTLDDSQGRICRFILKKLQLHGDDQGEYFYGQAKNWLIDAAEKKILEALEEIISVREVHEPIALIRYMKKTVDTMAKDAKKSKQASKAPKTEKVNGTHPEKSAPTAPLDDRPLWELPDYQPKPKGKL